MANYADILTTKGWNIFYSCNCGGTPKEHWNNPKYPTYEIRVRPRRQVFSILNRNLVIFGPDFLYKLENALKQYEID